MGELGERGRAWAETMSGGGRVGGVVLAHGGKPLSRVEPACGAGTASGLPPLSRQAREDADDMVLVRGATRARGAGSRALSEAPDPWRTCFERDRDRILHSTAFRRLAGKTQVFIFPADHQRTRLTHALEVAQVATGIARACRLNVTLTEAIALGHDCGHGPGGHSSEDALGAFLPEGYDHAPWGADVSLSSLNLCTETLDGIRNHSWSRPAPSTPEGEVVSWADRIAYVCHDWEDAVCAGIVAPESLPREVRLQCGERRSQQLGTFIGGVVDTILTTGTVGMGEDLAEALAAFRLCNYELVYLRPAAVEQGRAVIAVLRALVEHFADHPNRIPSVGEPSRSRAESGTSPAGTSPAGTRRSRAGFAGTDNTYGVEPVPLVSGSTEALRAAVSYVAGMTDRFAMATALAELGWDPSRLPRGQEDWRRY